MTITRRPSRKFALGDLRAYERGLVEAHARNPHLHKLQADSTVASTRSKVRQLIAAGLCIDATAAHVADVADRMRTNGLSDSSVAQNVRVASAIVRWLTMHDPAYSDFTPDEDAFSAKKTGTSSPQPVAGLGAFTESEQRRLVVAARELDVLHPERHGIHELVLRLGLGYGPRLGEFVAIKVTDVGADGDHFVINLRKTKTSEDGRTIILGQRLREVVLAYVAATSTDPAEDGTYPADRFLLLPGVTSIGVRRKAISDVVSAVIDHADLRKFAFRAGERERLQNVHCLRKSCLSNAFSRGVPPAQVSGQMGLSLKTATTYYFGLDNARRTEAVAATEAIDAELWA